MSRTRTTVGDELVRGVEIDGDTRCAHYDTDRDVVALRFGCCETYFSCHRCHAALTDHEALPWPRDRFDEPAVRCGVCGAAMTPPTYLGADHACPACDAPFNPGCANHAHLYFEGDGEGENR